MNGTGGTRGTSCGDYPKGRYATERLRAVFFVQLVPLVPHIPWNGTEQCRWSGPIDTPASRPGFADLDARGIIWKERRASARDSTIKRSACGWFIPTRPLRVLPPNKEKAVARLLPAPRSGCLPLPLPSHTRSRQETRPGIPPGPPRGRQSSGLRRTPRRRKC